MNHKQKIKLATRLRTKKEALEEVPIFQTQAWESRSSGIKKRVIKTQENQKEASRLAKLKVKK